MTQRGVFLIHYLDIALYSTDTRSTSYIIRQKKIGAISMCIYVYICIFSYVRRVKQSRDILIYRDCSSLEEMRA